MRKFFIRLGSIFPALILCLSMVLPAAAADLAIGSVLPETGGIGTKIFYALGGVLVVAASVILITKKRMQNKDEDENEE